MHSLNINPNSSIYLVIFWSCSLYVYTTISMLKTYSKQEVKSGDFIFVKFVMSAFAAKSWCVAWLPASVCWCGSGAVWPDSGQNICSIFGHLHQWELVQQHEKFAKVCSMFCHILNKPSTVRKQFIKLAKSGENGQIWSHWPVTRKCWRNMSLKNVFQNTFVFKIWPVIMQSKCPLWLNQMQK